MTGDDFTEPRYPRPRDFAPPAAQPQEESPIGADVVNWRELGDSEAAIVWAELDSWVLWLIQRYDLSPDKVGDCWWQHGAAVEELSALRTCWIASYDASDSGYGPIGFHERFDAALPRLARVFVSCKRHQHFPSTPRLLPGDREDWDTWTERSHARFNGIAEEERGI